MKKILPIFKNKKIPVFQIALIIIIIVCLGLIITQIINLGKVSKEVSTKRAILNEVDNGIRNFVSLKQELRSLEKTCTDFRNRLPSKKEFPVFLELLSRMAKDNNVKIIAIEPQELIDDPNLFFVKIPVFIDAYCGYHDLGKFINDLEYSDKLMRIDSIKISHDQNKDEEKNQVFLIIHAFCLKEENSAESNT